MTRTKKGGIRWALVAGFGLLIVLLISACGTSGVAGSKSTANPSLSPQQTALKFAQCMRANGYPNFPDPDASGRINLDPNSGLDPNDPTFQKAQQACASIVGASGSTTTGGTGR